MAEKSFGAKNIDVSQNLNVSNNLNVSGVGTFTTGLDLDGYLEDKDGETGSNGQVLISAEDGGSQKVQWANLSVVTSSTDSTGIGFTDLNDTPSALGGAGKIITVNALNTELEFSTNNFLNLDDTPSAYNNGKLLVSTSSGIGFTDTTTLTKLVVSGPLVEKFTRISGTTSPSLDLRDGNVFQLVLGSSTTVVAFTNCPASSGEAYSFTLIVTNTVANIVIQWPTSVKWAADTGASNYAPTRTKAAGKSDVWVFTTYDGGTTFLGVLASFGYDGLPIS